MQADNELVDGLINKDPIIIGRFIDLFGSFVYSIVFNVCGTKQDSEEATQDVILKVLKHIEKYDYSSSLKTWIYTIAKRTAIDYKRRIKYSLNIDEVYDMKSESSTSNMLDKMDERKMIDALLTELKEDDRELVELYYLQELSNAEIAEITGLSLSNIKVKLFRARKLLADKMDKYIDYEI